MEVSTKQRSWIRYSKELADKEEIEKFFRLFLHKRRVEHGIEIFKAFCSLEVKMLDTAFSIKEVAQESNIEEHLVRRIVYDFERMGLADAHGTKRLKERSYQLDVKGCTKGLAKLPRQLRNFYKNTHQEAQNVRK